MASPTTPAHASEHDDPTQAEVSDKAAKAEAAKAARMAKAAATKAKKAEAKAKADAVALAKTIASNSKYWNKFRGHDASSACDTEVPDGNELDLRTEVDGEAEAGVCLDEAASAQLPQPAPVSAASSEASPKPPAGSNAGPSATTVAPAVAPAAAPAATIEHPFTTAAPAIVSKMPQCYRCKGDVDVLRAPLVGKSAGAWKCHQCNTKGTQLYRLFGTWPTDSFKRLHPDVQTRFYQQAKDKAGKQQLEELLIHTLTQVRIEQEETSVGGEYLPLSVYAARGFNVSDIESKCNDKEEHAVLGTCYRVDIRAAQSKTIEQMVRKEVQELKDAKGKKGTHEAEPDNASDIDVQPKEKKVTKEKKDTKKKKDTKDTNEQKDKPPKKEKKKKHKETTNKKSRKRKSSSSSSSSTSGLEEEPDSKTQKRLEQQRKKDEQAVEKAAKANLQLCKRVLARIEAPRLSLERDLNDDVITHVPDFAKKPATESFKALQAVHGEFQQVFKQRGIGMTVSCTIEDIDKLAKRATQDASLLGKVIATARASLDLKVKRGEIGRPGC